MRRKMQLLTGIFLLVGLAACSTLPAATKTPPPAATATLLPPTARPPTQTAIPATATRAGPTATPRPKPELARIQMIDAKHGWATNYGDNGGRIMRTSDGGSTWVDVTPVNLTNVTNQINSSGASFFLDTQTAWTIEGDLAQAASGSGQMLRTSDGGATWQAFNAPFTTGNLSFIDSKKGWMRADPNCGAGSCWIKIFNTTDGGETWNLQPVSNPYGSEPNLTPGTIHEISGDDIVFSDEHTVWFGGNDLVSATKAVFYVSRDSGQNWQKEELPLPADAVNNGAPVIVDLPIFVDSKDAFLAAKYQVKGADANNKLSMAMVFYTSQDGGQSWLALQHPVANVDAFTQMGIVSTNDAFVHCGDALCTTHDGAKTWRVITSNLSFKNSDTRSLGGLDFINATTGWAIVVDGTSYLLYQTQDGGVTWNELALTVQAVP